MKFHHTSDGRRKFMVTHVLFSNRMNYLELKVGPSALKWVIHLSSPVEDLCNRALCTYWLGIFSCNLYHNLSLFSTLREEEERVEVTVYESILIKGKFLRNVFDTEVGLGSLACADLKMLPKALVCFHRPKRKTGEFSPTRLRLNLWTRYSAPLRKCCLWLRIIAFVGLEDKMGSEMKKSNAKPKQLILSYSVFSSCDLCVRGHDSEV